MATSNNDNYYFQVNPYKAISHEPQDLVAHINILEECIYHAQREESQKQFDMVMGLIKTQLQGNQHIDSEYELIIALEKFTLFLSHYFKKKITDHIYLFVLNHKLSRINTSPKNNNLIKITTIKNIGSIQREINRNNAWWTMNTKRQSAKNTSHQYTNSIILYNRLFPWYSSQLNTQGQKVYSQATSVLKFFPATHKAIKEIESQIDGTIGRVALVRLKPHSIVSPHCDGEWQLRGFDRYHLVIDSPEGSYMQSGTESKTFHNGDLFFFENKKSHTAYNATPYWRTHLIIDIRPSNSKQCSLNFSTYQDWSRWSHINHPDAPHGDKNKS